MNYLRMMAGYQIRKLEIEVQDNNLWFHGLGVKFEFEVLKKVSQAQGKIRNAAPKDRNLRIILWF